MAKITGLEDKLSQRYVDCGQKASVQVSGSVSSSLSLLLERMVDAMLWVREVQDSGSLVLE